MAYIFYNPNPVGRMVGDCAIRAIAKALNMSWETAYISITINGYSMGDMPSSDSVWGATLRQNGFYRTSIPSTCPDYYTAEDFCKDHPEGIYVLGFGGHVALLWMEIFMILGILVKKSLNFIGIKRRNNYGIFTISG